MVGWWRRAPCTRSFPHGRDSGKRLEAHGVGPCSARCAASHQTDENIQGFGQVVEAPVHVSARFLEARIGMRPLLPEADVDLLPKRHETLIDGHEAPIDGLEALIDGLEAPIDGLEVPIDGLEAPIDGLEVPIDGLEVLIDNAEALIHALLHDLELPGHCSEETLVIHVFEFIVGPGAVR